MMWETTLEIAGEGHIRQQMKTNKMQTHDEYVSLATAWLIESNTDGLDKEQWFIRLTDEQKMATLADLRERAAKYADTLVSAIEDKNIGQLLLSCHNGNKVVRRLFTEITGLKTGPTERDNRDAIKTWVGEEAWNVYHDAKQAERERRDAESLAKHKQAEMNHVLNQRVHYRPESGGVVETVTMKQFIDRIISDGYTRLTSHKRGIATVWELWKDNRRFVFRKKLEVEYIMSKLEEVQQPV